MSFVDNPQGFQCLLPSLPGGGRFSHSQSGTTGDWGCYYYWCDAITGRPLPAVCGGYGYGDTNNCLSLNSSTGQWAASPQLLQPRYCHVLYGQELTRVKVVPSTVFDPNDPNNPNDPNEWKLRRRLTVWYIFIYMCFLLI